MASPLLAFIAAASLANGATVVATTRPADALPGARVAVAKPVALVSAKAAPKAGACLAVKGKSSLIRGRVAKAKCSTNPQAVPAAAAAPVALGTGAGTTVATVAAVAAGVSAAAAISYAAVQSTNTTVSGG